MTQTDWLCALVHMPQQCNALETVNYGISKQVDRSVMNPQTNANHVVFRIRARLVFIITLFIFSFGCNILALNRPSLDRVKTESYSVHIVSSNNLLILFFSYSSQVHKSSFDIHHAKWFNDTYEMQTLKLHQQLTFSATAQNAQIIALVLFQPQPFQSKHRKMKEKNGPKQ